MAWALGAKSLSGDGISAHFGIPAEVKDPMLHTGETGAAFNVALSGDARAVIESPDRIGRSRQRPRLMLKDWHAQGRAAQLEVVMLCARTPEKVTRVVFELKRDSSIRTTRRYSLVRMASSSTSDAMSESSRLSSSLNMAFVLLPNVGAGDSVCGVSPVKRMAECIC